MSLLAAIAEAFGRCPPGWKLTRAVTEIPESLLANHLRRCERCAAELEALRELLVQTRVAFAEPEPMSEGERDTISLHLLAETPRPRREKRTLSKAMAAVVTLAAAGALLVIAVHDHKTPPRSQTVTSHASVRAMGQATFSRVQAPPDELLRVDEGTIDLEVSPLVGTERFRVLTADAEVEVRGTSFRVVAHDRKLMAVTVFRGRVEVRPFGGGVAVLDAGDSWARGKPELEEGSPTAQGSTAAPHPLNRPPPVGPGSEPAPSPSRARRSDRKESAGQSFDRAWALLRGGEAKAAADAFGEVARLAPGSALEEDALYWRAVSTARAQDRPAAARLFGEFLDRFPSSSRAGEAAVALGWIRVDEGHLDDARALFKLGARDPAPEVRASAEDGLRRTQR